MTDPKRTIPASVPVVNTEAPSNTGSGLGTTEVSATAVPNNSVLDKSPDARQTNGTTQTVNDASAQQPLPTNRDKELKKLREQQAKKQAALEKKKKKADKDKQQTQQGQTQQAPQTPSGASSAVPASSGTGTQQPSQNPPSHP